MIFASKNEKNEPKIDKILALKPGEVMTTTRLNPLESGLIRSVQPNRCKKSVAHILILNCHKRSDHFDKCSKEPGFNLAIWRQKEAELEGFYSWDGLMVYFKDHKLDFMGMYRLAFIREPET